MVKIWLRIGESSFLSIFWMKLKVNTVMAFTR